MKKFNQKKKLPAPQTAHFLKGSLLKLLGTGLLTEKEPKPSEIKAMVIKNALNAVVLRG